MKRRRLWIAFGILIAGIVLLIFLLDIPHWKKLDMTRILAAPESTVVLDADGNEFGTLAGGAARRFVRLDAVPESVRKAFIAAEDQRFYEHNGFDLTRIFGALWHDITTRSLSQGASTITQQLIKLTHLSGEKTFSRKAQEIVLALRLEKKLTKDEILEAYLNAVYFGSGAYGIASAAETFFGKDVGALTVAEGALLAGVIKSPSGYAPDRNPERALERRNRILGSMRALDFISQEEYDAAAVEPLKLNMKETGSFENGWFLDAALNETSDALGMDTEEILSAGLHICTAFRPKLQAEMDALFENGANFPDPAADGTPVQAAMVAMDPANGEIAAMAGGRQYAVRRGLNRATDMRRQPGSAIKPVSTYAAAIDRYGFLPTSMIEDVQREFADKYLPGNAGGAYYGTVTLREALSRSLNVATVDLADLTGMTAVRDQIEQFGIPLAPQDVNLSLALGSMTYGVSPARLCAAYCALANGGTRVEPHVVRRITSADGKVLYEAKKSDAHAVSPQTAFLITDMLKTAAATGSAKALAGTGVPVAGKTGTVSEPGGGNRDIWTAAYTPELTVALWMGFDEPDAAHRLPDWAGGSSYPAQLCAAFLKRISSELGGRDFTVPEGLTAVRIDTTALRTEKRVLLAAENTPDAYAQTEWFRENQLPTEVTALWEAPEAIDDLTLLSGLGETPVLAFTAKSGSAEYLILRKVAEDTEIAAALHANAGEVIVFSDTDADIQREIVYTVLPRNRLLYESGVTLTGPESNSVRCVPGGLLNRILG